MPGLEDYKPVKQRIHEFRQEHPDWAIYTSLERPDEAHWLATATIRDTAGNQIATGHAYEKALKPFDAEKAETSAVGRALVFAGWTDSLDLSQEERERSEGVAEQRKATHAPPTPQPVERDSAAPQTMPHILKNRIAPHPDPKPQPIEDMMRLEKPVQSAPKGYWQEFVKELVVADQTENIGIPWKELTYGKGFNDLTAIELKELVDRVDKWLHSEDEL
jgi:hypothetical protein